MRKKMISFIVVCSFLVTVLPLTASADREGSVGETLTIPTVSDVLEQLVRQEMLRMNPRSISGTITATIFRTVLGRQVSHGTV